MDPHAVAIEHEVAFGFEAAAEVPAFAAPALEERVDAAAPDLDLCKKAAAGNIAAFELLYERYHRRTYSLCLRMTSSQTEAEDLTQEVFIQVFRKVGSFPAIRHFRLLHRADGDQVLMHFRRRSVKNSARPRTVQCPSRPSLAREPGQMQVVDRIALKKRSPSCRTDTGRSSSCTT